MILRFAASLQDRWLRLKYRRYIVQPPRIAYADDAIKAHVNAVRYRKYRARILAAVLLWALARRLTR